MERSSVSHCALASSHPEINIRVPVH